jgi:exopolysaccharide biosynthesis polyprenyl glycosylphosphotransferase
MNSSDRTFREGNRRSAYTAITVVHDALVIFISLAAGYAINFQTFSFGVFLSQQWKLVLYSIVLYVGLSAMLGVYRQVYTSPLRLQIGAAVRAYALGTLIIFATLFLFRNTYYSNGALVTYVLVIPLAFLFGRLVLDRLRAQFQKRKWGLEPTIVVLLDGEGGDQLRNLASYPSIGFDVQSVIDIARLDDNAAHQKIGEGIAAHMPTCIIYSSSSIDSPRLSSLVAGATASNIMTRLVTPEVHEVLTRMRLYDFGGIALSYPPRVALSTTYRALKRGFDVLLSIVFVAVAAPVLLIIVLAIRLESAGGVLFRQVRYMSKRSDPLWVFKFRSMTHNGAEQPASNGNGLQLADEMLFKSPDDPRITRVGRLMRKYSIDELPQLFNVIAGDMSLVGPRPLPIADFSRLPSGGTIASLAERRALVKPGLTGLWQISGRSGLRFRQMVILDLYYAEHQSFLFDLEILFETIPAVITGRGAY